MVARVHQHVKSRAIQSDCNKNAGQGSTKTLMITQTLSEKAQLKKGKNRKLQLWLNQALMLRNLSGGTTHENFKWLQ